MTTRIREHCIRLVSVVISPQARFALLVGAAVTTLFCVVGGVVILELIAARPGHIEQGCSSISRILGFGSTIFTIVGLGLRQEFLDRRAARRQEKLQVDVRHDVANKVQPVLSAVEDVKQQAEITATKAEAAVVKAQASAEKVEQATNGNLAEAVRVAAEQARAAEREQMMTDPRFWASVDANFRRIVNQILDERGKPK